MVTSLTHRRYQPLSLLGEGGQGTVLRVRDIEDPARELCAKVYRRGESTIPGEFALLSRSRLPGLVRAHDMAKDERTGAPFLVEDFIRGCDAAAFITGGREEARGERLVSLLAQVGTTLGALHQLGFVHGDLKPAHVRFSEDGRATLLDLGSALLTRDDGSRDAFPATRGYIAPEILAGGRPTVHSDLYALGALAWRCSTQRPLGEGEPRALRELAPWVVPSVADIVTQLLAPHPRDRPASAEDLLRKLGASPVRPAFAGDTRLAPRGRERLFDELLEAPRVDAHVRYVVGPSGSGKSHLGRALLTAALLRGVPARMISFSEERKPPLDRWLAVLRGHEGGEARKKADTGDEPMSSGAPLLLILDDLEQAPSELVHALDLYRCRPAGHPELHVIALAREAPLNARAWFLEPLDDACMGALARDLGVESPRAIADLVRASRGSVGFAVAALGRVPLTREAAIERTQGLSSSAKTLLGAIAAAGGSLGEETLRRAFSEDTTRALAELLESALVGRSAKEERTYSLSAPHLAKDLADAIVTFEIVDGVVDAVLSDASSKAAVVTISFLASGKTPPSRRTELLRLGAARAREVGLRESEMDFLLALAADPAERSVDRLQRLERLTRDTGRATLHPEVLGWLHSAAAESPALVPLVLRRQAEAKARASAHQEAALLVDEAEARAAQLGDRTAQALCLATRGAVELYRANWAKAEHALTAAKKALSPNEADPEEVARLEHNFGVVALYGGHAERAREAFERSLAQKRALGDRAGIRACLLNLGITLAKLGRLDEADVTLQEAQALAETLGQAGGRGWCLAARADVEIRRKSAERAERHVAEAEAMGDKIPRAVRADLAVLRAGACLLEGDGERALAALERIDPALRESDALIDARAQITEARASLLLLPSDRRRAARLAVRAIRRSRTAQIAETEQEAKDVLAQARKAPAARRGAARYPDPQVEEARATSNDDPAWNWMSAVGNAIPLGEAAFQLARLVADETRAERALVAIIDDSDRVVEAVGADIDGFSIAEAAHRLPLEEIKAALRKTGPSYLRDIKTPLGTGARLVIASTAPPRGLRVALVAEHRSWPDCFDSVPRAMPARWATLGGILARLWTEASTGGRTPNAQAGLATPPSAISRPSSRVQEDEVESTSIPLRRPVRSFPDIIGESKALRRALGRLDAAIDSDLPVLIVGETGTGKELFARALHELGGRASAPFVAVNCGAIPDNLFEAEFFGHARGSFTGAERARRGLIGAAEHGTLLLDEVGELPALRQASLLRALETKKYRPVGSDHEQNFDTRIVAATHKDLGRAANEGTFRSDLLYRLNVIEIRVPPLRSRTEDIELLAHTFLRAAGSTSRLSATALALLRSYDWPGNVRELEHHMQRLATLGLSEIGPNALPRQIRNAPRLVKERPAKLDPEQARQEVEQALSASGGNISHAAERLGMTRHGLKKRMVRLGMRKGAKS